MEYNAAGSLVKETTGADVTYYVWGADEMLDAVQLPDASWNYFSYDGDQRRWQKTDSDGTKRYRWNAGTSGKPGLAVVQEADETDTTTAQYTHDQGVTIMPGVGTILSVREDSASHFLHTDAQGTTREATDSSQAIDATYDLDAFGVFRGSSGAFTTPYLFTGKERDPGPGLDYFIARQYQSVRGVFLSKDPIPTPTWMYSYAHQGPLSGWDPEGRIPKGAVDLCMEMRDLVATWLPLPRMPSCEDAEALYGLIADYLEAMGWPIAAEVWRAWLSGASSHSVELGRVLDIDPALRDYVDGMREAAVSQIYVSRGCCEPGTGVGACTGCVQSSDPGLFASLGHFTLRLQVHCQWGPLSGGTAVCTEDVWLEDVFDWLVGADLPCLGGCDIGIPIGGTIGTHLSETCGLGTTDIRSHRLTQFEIPCRLVKPHTATACPAPPVARWPSGPYWGYPPDEYAQCMADIAMGTVERVCSRVMDRIEDAAIRRFPGLGGWIG